VTGAKAALIGSMHLQGIAEHLGGELRGGDVSFSEVSTDTRTLQQGALYVALKGANFDGNEFVEQARQKGACAAVVERPVPAQIPQLVVADSTRALGQLGALNRSRSTATIVGITGSQGKTTVKEMTGAILAAAGPTLVTQGNLNNAIGVPLTLLKFTEEHRFGVIEMGANRGGEIAYSVNLVKPDIVTITNAARAHIEGFGSLAGVAESKGEIIDGLRRGGTLVLNRDDRFREVWRKRAAGRRVVSFSLQDTQADCYASEMTIDQAGKARFTLHVFGAATEVRLGLLGRHNIGNAVAAAALASVAGADLAQVKKGLEFLKPVKGRLCPVDTDLGGVLIDDSYNASPESFKAAINVLAQFPGQRILLMGDMAELGGITQAAHRELGEYARQAGVDELWTVGSNARLSTESFGDGARHFANKQDITDRCLATLGPGVALLVKGSRSAGLDEVVRALGKAGTKN